MVSTPKSDAARLFAADAARRATSSPAAAPSSAPATTSPAPAQTDKTRDVLAAAVIDNERARPANVASSRATPSLPATPTGIATAAQGPFRVPGNDAVVFTPAQTAALDNDSTRFVTAMEIAGPIAKHEAVEQAFGSPQQFASAQRVFADLPAAERATLLGNVAQTTDLQGAILAQPAGGARNDFVDAMRARAGLTGGALPIDDGSIDMRASEIEMSLLTQSQSVRLTDDERARGVTSGMGAVRAVAGGAAMFVGGSAALTPTGVGQVVGGAVALHGLDNFQAGVRQALSGEEVRNVTEQAIAAGAEQLGVDAQTAATIGIVGDALVSFGGSATLSTLASTTAKASTIVGPS